MRYSKELSHFSVAAISAAFSGSPVSNTMMPSGLQCLNGCRNKCKQCNMCRLYQITPNHTAMKTTTANDNNVE
jgi:hypothetical protein